MSIAVALPCLLLAELSRPRVTHNDPKGSFPVPRLRLRAHALTRLAH